tara:strand:+ start:2460 stop:2903 length:444 start_codon:yes stop_codon:yes gene_type:complete
MVRPIKVQPGEWSEAQDLLEKARDLEARLEKASETDDSEMRDVRGVEEVRPAYYWTNQQLPDDPEVVQRATPKAENVRFLQANPHDGDGALSAHVTEGGTGRPEGITNEKTLFGKGKTELLGAWKEDNPFVIKDLVEKAESLARRLD